MKFRNFALLPQSRSGYVRLGLALLLLLVVYRIGWQVPLPIVNLGQIYLN